MKGKRPPNPRTPPSKAMLAFASRLQALGTSQAAILADLRKPLLPSHWPAVLQEAGRRADAYDRRLFGRFKVEYGEWRLLVLTMAGPITGRKRTPVESPTELDSLTPEQWQAIARLMDANWQKHMAETDWNAALAFGRPEVKQPVGEAKAMAERKLSKSGNARHLAVTSKGKRTKRQILYADQKARTRAKVSR
ncbi:MAG: hypothetical protein ACT4O6_12665 [Reyranella sp.]